jgi:hypothetical protein
MPFSLEELDILDRPMASPFVSIPRFFSLLARVAIDGKCVLDYEIRKWVLSVEVCRRDLVARGDHSQYSLITRPKMRDNLQLFSYGKHS